jgi:hypothetical protein
MSICGHSNIYPQSFLLCRYGLGILVLAYTPSIYQPFFFGFMGFIFVAWRSLYDYAFYDAMVVLFFSLIRAPYTAGMV